MEQLTERRTSHGVDPRGALLSARLVALAGGRRDAAEALGPLLAAVARAFGTPVAHVLRRGPDGRLVLAGQHGLDHLAERVGVPAALPGAGQAAAVLDHGQSRCVHDVAGVEPWLDLWHDGTAGSALLAPLAVHGAGAWGCLAVEHPDACALDEGDLEALRGTAAVLGELLARLDRDASEAAFADRDHLRRRVLEASAAVVTAGLAGPDTTRAAQAMLPAATATLSWPAAAVLRRSASGWEVLAVVGDDDVRPGDRVPASGAMDGVVGPVVHASDATGPTPPVLAGRDTVVVPLPAAGRVQHLLVVDPGDTASPRPEHTVAAVAAVAARMALVLERLELLGNEQRAVQRLAEVDRMRANLLAVAGHELRTPLTIVVGYADTLREQATALSPEQLTAAASKLGDRARHLSELVDRVLLAARLESGDVEFVPRTVHLGDLVEEAGWTVGVELGTGLRDAVVRADPHWLDRALGLLVEHSRSVARRSVVLDARPRDDRVAVVLRDDGDGVPGYERERLFRPFTHDGVAGQETGLGPGVARGLVERMGGELRLYSAPGYGSTFLVLLPGA